jgi:hypothetical protein
VEAAEKVVGKEKQGVDGGRKGWKVVTEMSTGAAREEEETEKMVVQNREVDGEKGEKAIMESTGV